MPTQLLELTKERVRFCFLPLSARKRQDLTPFMYSCVIKREKYDLKQSTIMKTSF